MLWIPGAAPALVLWQETGELSVSCGWDSLSGQLPPALSRCLGFVGMQWVTWIPGSEKGWAFLLDTTHILLPSPGLDPVSPVEQSQHGLFSPEWSAEHEAQNGVPSIPGNSVVLGRKMSPKGLKRGRWQVGSQMWCVSGLLKCVKEQVCSTMAGAWDRQFCSPLFF